MSLDPLNAFYNECRVAPVPSSLTLPTRPLSLWARLAVPLGGLSLGGLLALLIVAFPAPASPEAAAKTADAIAFAQFKAIEGPPLALFGGSSEKGEGAGGEGSGNHQTKPIPDPERT